MVMNRSRVVSARARRLARVPLGVSCTLLGLGLALAAPGNLDPGFGSGGLLSSPVVGYGGAVAIVQQDDDKLVLAGSGALESGRRNGFVAMRLTPSGATDATFGNAGVASVYFADHAARVSAMVLQADGKLLLAGSTGTADDSSDIALARFNADGTVDTSFGAGGKVTLDIAGGHDFAYAAVQQTSGKIVIAGQSGLEGFSSRCVLARFNTDGTLDTTFGTDGKTLIDFGGIDCWPTALVRQSDDRLVAVGWVVSGSSDSDAAIMRVSATGALDASFSGDGLLEVDIGGNYDHADGVAIQADGTIFVVGWTAPDSGDSLYALFLRIDGGGNVDNRFLTHELPDATLDAVVVQDDGKLVASGTRYPGHGVQDMILARFRANGVIDPTYGIDGVATADFGTGDSPDHSSGVAMVRQHDGKYVVAGPNPLPTFGAARFDDAANFAGRIGFTSTREGVFEPTSSKVNYTVRRTGGSTGAVTVDYATSSGSAEGGMDFENRSGTLSWADGDASEQTIAVDLIDDSEPEANEDFALTLSATTGGADLAATRATTTIVSEEIGMRDTAPTVAENVGTVVLTVTRGGTEPFGVSYQSSPGTATGSDFTAVSGTLAWGRNDTADKTISIDITNDTEDESDETFTIALSNPSGDFLKLGPKSIATVTIVDDDASSGGGGDGGGGGALDWLVALLLVGGMHQRRRSGRWLVGRQGVREQAGRGCPGRSADG